ncbi:MAG: hypothetical protein JJT75_09725 [Opitutales bacterium]|nr:hypothetical protein [Opitutales bacterium]MCH8539972.1 hypothetical protein [Opitutales bacterium]
MSTLITIRKFLFLLVLPLIAWGYFLDPEISSDTRHNLQFLVIVLAFLFLMLRSKKEKEEEEIAAIHCHHKLNKRFDANFVRRTVSVSTSLAVASLILLIIASIGEWQVLFWVFFISMLLFCVIGGHFADPEKKLLCRTSADSSGK